MSLFRRFLGLLVLCSVVLAILNPVCGQVAAFVQPEGASGTVHFIDREGNVTDTGVGILGGSNSHSGYMGRVLDFDNDGYLEVPVAEGDGDLVLVSKGMASDPDGTREVLVTEVAATNQSASDPSSMLGIGDQDEDGEPEILFQNDNQGDQIYRVGIGDSSPQQVQGGIGVDAVIGYGDLNRDGDKDVVYVGDGSDQIDFYDDGEEFTTGTGPANNKGRGLGPVIDLDRYGNARVLYMNGSQNPTLLRFESNGVNSKEKVASVGTGTKAPMGGDEPAGRRALRDNFSGE